jgi:hypothetical protein
MDILLIPMIQENQIIHPANPSNPLNPAKKIFCLNHDPPTLRSGGHVLGGLLGLRRSKKSRNPSCQSIKSPQSCSIKSTFPDFAEKVLI